MSNALAIATVTETLLQQLSSSLEGAQVAGALVTALRPDASTGLPSPGINIFLYQVAPNTAWRNADAPTRAADGTLLRRPQVALDLYYLLTFYGDDNTLEQQRLLGAAARAINANPVLQRADIQNTQSSVAFLNGADLADQPELVRFTPIHFSLEELSKLWSVFLKTDYVLSVAYVASVVLIETDDVVGPPPLPVLAPNVYAMPFPQPLITQIVSVAGAGAPITPSSQIVLIGQFPLASVTPGSPPTTAALSVIIGAKQLVPDSVSATQITVTLPAGLSAGAQTAQVAESLMIGTPPSPHAAGFQSSAGAFVLHPVIRQGSPPGSYAINVQKNSGSPPTTTVTVTVDPAIAAGQRVLLELIRMNAPRAVFLFDGGTIATATNTAAFTLGLQGSQVLAAGEYLVQVRVDGAESPLDLDSGGNPIGPLITL